MQNDYDIVKKPKHYILNIKGQEIQVKDVISAITAKYDSRLAYPVANAIKYLARATEKNGKQDIEKAITCVNFILEDWDDVYGEH